MIHHNTNNDPRYTGKDGYFNLDGYLYLIGANLDKKTKFPKKSILLIINAERNMGKSYGSWWYIENSLWIPSNYKWKVAYCRTNKEKMKKARDSFNAFYFYGLKKYWMSETKIFKIKLDEKGKEIWEERIEIGSLITVNNEENFKSGIFDEYHMIFYDEYNEDNENPDLWDNFCNLMKTVKRRSEPFFVLLVGNKINPNNDFLVNLGIEVSDEDTGEDEHQELPGNIHFIDISRKTFQHLNTKDDIVNMFASYNTRTDRYLNEGKYLIEVPDDVRIFNKRIKPSKKIKYYLALDEDKFEYGKFFDEKTNQEAYYIHRLEDCNNIDKCVKMIVLDKLADIRNKLGMKMLGDDDYIDFANHLRYNQKGGKLFYSTFACKTLIERFVIKTVNLVE